MALGLKVQMLMHSTVIIKKIIMFSQLVFVLTIFLLVARPQKYV
jgi:hypothetical protein